MYSISCTLPDLQQYIIFVYFAVVLYSKALGDTNKEFSSKHVNPNKYNTVYKQNRRCF